MADNNASAERPAGDDSSPATAAAPPPQNQPTAAETTTNAAAVASTSDGHQHRAPPSAVAHTPTDDDDDDDDDRESAAEPQTPLPQHPQRREIPAAKVRSGLSDLERHTTQVLNRLENLRCTPAPNGAAAAEALMSAAFLPADRRGPGEIFGCLEALITQTDAATVQSAGADDAGGAATGAFALPALDDVSHLALLTHTLCAYMQSMEPRRLQRLTGKICADTQRWLAHLFRFIDAQVSYHTDGTEALLRAVRLALVQRCPGWLEGGVAAAAQPCLYAGDGQTKALQFVCRQLGLAASSVRAVPLLAGADGPGSMHMDCAGLQRLIATDVAAGRTPVLAVAECGSTMGLGVGYVDDLARVQSVCRAAGVWLHCRGHALAAVAALGRAPEAGGGVQLQQPQPLADSLALTVGGWLALPNLPVALLHRPVHNVSLATFESDPVLSRRLTAMSLWTTLQALGRDQIAERLQLAFDASRQWYEICASFGATVRVLSKGLSDEARTMLDEAAADSRPLNYAQLFDTAVTSVVFQFNGHAVQTNSAAAAAAEPPSDSAVDPLVVPGNPFEEPAVGAGAANDAATQLLVRRSMERVANSSYFDKLNSWLAQNMQRDCPDVELEMIDHPAYGTCMRFCPFELGLGQLVPDREQLEHAAQCLEMQVDILRATVRHRGTLQRLVAANGLLRMVALPDWAGLGGVRFVPDGWERLLTGDGRVELNRLNQELVDALRSTDNAFSMGEGADGLLCVRFGMVTEDTDVEELLDLVVSVGGRVQENSKVLDSMAEIVKKGIETATADLQRESEEKLWSEGILRHVPVFGQVVNWWSPPVKETGIKGRSLNLTQGVVESTENIYKYHMQLSAHNQPIHGTKSPPAPLVQTSVSTGHSRNVSQGGSSTTSAAVVVTAAAAAAAGSAEPAAADGSVAQ